MFLFLAFHTILQTWRRKCKKGGIHVATFRDLRIYEHPGTYHWPLPSPFDMYRIQTDTNTNVSLSTRHGHVFSAGALTLDLERSSLPRAP